MAATKQHLKNGLPTGQGFYWRKGKKKKTVWLALWHNRQKLQFDTGADIALQGASIGTATEVRKAAEKFRRDKIKELEAQGVPVVAGVTCQELFEDHLAFLRSKEKGNAYMEGKKVPSYTTANSMKNLGYVIPEKGKEGQRGTGTEPFGNLSPSKITTDLLVKYKADRLATGVGVQSTNHELSYFRSSLIRGYDATPRKVDHVPSFKGLIEKVKSRKRAIKVEEKDGLCPELPQYLNVGFNTLYYGGIRPKEMSFVRPSQVDFTAGQLGWISLRAGETKSGEPRIVPIHPALRQLLLDWEAQTKRDYPATKWFFHRNGEKFPNDVKDDWGPAMTRAGLVHQAEDDETKWENDFKFYHGRHTCSTNIRDYIGRDDVDKLLGHETPGAGTIYDLSEPVPRIEEGMMKQYAVSMGLSQKLSLSTPLPDAIRDLILSHAPIKPGMLDALAGTGKSAKKVDKQSRLTELKELFEKKLIPQAIYDATVSEILSA